MTQKKMSLIEKIGNIDNRVLYWIMSILMIVTLVNPIGLPILISQHTRNFNEVFEQQQSGVVLLSIEMGLALIPELGPSLDVILNELFERDIEVIFIGFRDLQPAIYEMLVSPVLEKYPDKEYGIDYVNLGFLTGGETALKRLAGDIPGTIVYDGYGTPMEDIPMIQNIKDATDVDLIIVFDPSSWTENYIRHWVLPYGNRLISSLTMTVVSGVLPFVDAGNCLGFIGGMRGAAELELLTHRPGAAIRRMDSISSAHLFLIVLIVLGNIVFLYKSFRR